MKKLLFIIAFFVMSVLPSVSQTTLWIDPLFTGTSTGTSAAPFKSISSAMSTANTDLASGAVTLMISACDPTCTTEESIDGFSSSQRTDTSSNILTIDGMSNFQTNTNHAGAATWSTNFVPPTPPSSVNPGFEYAKSLLRGTSSTVNTAGNTLIYVSGDAFNAQWGLVGKSVTVNGVSNTITSCSTDITCTLTTSAGTQTGVSFTSARVLRAQMTGSVPWGSTDSFSNCKGFITAHGLDISNNNGQTMDATYTHDLIIEYVEAHRTAVGAGGPTIYIGPGQHGPCHTGAARPSGTDSGPDNVTVRYSDIHEGWGESIYSGASTSDPFVAATCTSCQQTEAGTTGDNLACGNGCGAGNPACTTATAANAATCSTGAHYRIIGNTIESGAAWGGQGDGMDIKDGHSDLKIIGNTVWTTKFPACAPTCTNLVCYNGTNAGTACTSNAQCTGGGVCGAGSDGRGMIIEGVSLVDSNFVEAPGHDAIDLGDSWNNNVGKSSPVVSNNFAIDVNSGSGHNNALELEGLNVSGLFQWSNTSFINNTVFNAGNNAGNTADGILTSTGADSGTITVRNNIVHTANTAISATGNVDHNMCFNSGGTCLGTGSTNSTNPQFISTSTPYIDQNFKLNGASAAAGAGASGTGVTTDYFGNTRPTNPTIGAFELQGIPVITTTPSLRMIGYMIEHHVFDPKPVAYVKDVDYIVNKERRSLD